MTDTSTTDPVTMLAAHRPDDATLLADWPGAERTELRERVLSADRGDVRETAQDTVRTRFAPRRRWVAATAVAGGVAAAVLLGVLAPADSPGGPDPASAAALRKLAIVAGQQGDPVGAGQFAYHSGFDRQAEPQDGPLTPDETRDGRFVQRGGRTWVAPDGTTWSQDRFGPNSQCLTKYPSVSESAENGAYEDLPSAKLAQLPTDPKRLATFFDKHPSGDNRGDKNRQIAATDLVRSGLATPQLRAAALRVLADTPGLRTESNVRDARGRAAIVIRRNDHDRYVDATYFDPATSAILEERTYKKDGSKEGYFSGVVLRRGVVEALPDLPACRST